MTCCNSTVHNSWPTKRQQQARLQAPASDRGTWQEACKSVGRKGKVIRNNKQENEGARKLKECPCGRSMWAREHGPVQQKCRRGWILLGAPATKQSSSLLWVSPTGSSSAHLPRETLPAFDSGRCFPSEQNPESCVGFGQQPLSLREKFQAKEKETGYWGGTNKLKDKPQPEATLYASLTDITRESGVSVAYLPTKKWGERERAYPASIASDPLCPVTAHNISKASCNTFSNIPCLENTDSNPDDLNKTKKAWR